MAVFELPFVQRKTTAAACVVIQYVRVWGVALLPETT